jgi:hypothetical protein
VTSPVGFRGYLLEATSFVVAAPEECLNRLQWVAQQLRLDPPWLVAEPLALAAACPGEGLIVNAGAHTTGLALVRYGAPLACGSVPYGGARLTRALAEAFELPSMRAEALKRGYGAGQLSDEGTAAVRQVLEAPLQAWISALTERLSSWTEVPAPWPPDIYVSGGAAALEDLRQALSAARWLDTLPFPKTPEVRLWDGSTLYPVIDHGDLDWRADQVASLSVAAWTLRDRGAGTPEATLRSALAL